MRELEIWKDKGIRVFENQKFVDERGFFSEIYNKKEFEKFGLNIDIKQENYSGSEGGVIRGLHYQYEPPQAKIMRVSLGKAFLVAVDLRRESPEYGKWYGKISDDEDDILIYAEAGFARGFKAMSNFVEIHYLCTENWNKKGEDCIVWDDPDIGIEWPETKNFHLKISEKDRKGMSFEEFDENYTLT